jgi:cell division protein FtsB
METVKQNMNADKTNISQKENGETVMKKIFRYQWIMNNLNFILFLSLLAVLYIANGHTADKTIRRINKTQNDVKDLQYQYKTLKSEVMFKSEESEVLKQAAPLGLKVSTEIPQRLQIAKSH